jgi:hypothetical protein
MGHRFELKRIKGRGFNPPYWQITDRLLKVPVKFFCVTYETADLVQGSNLCRKLNQIHQKPGGKNGKNIS